MPARKRKRTDTAATADQPAAPIRIPDEETDADRKDTDDTTAGDIEVESDVEPADLDESTDDDEDDDDHDDFVDGADKRHNREEEKVESACLALVKLLQWKQHNEFRRAEHRFRFLMRAWLPRELLGVVVNFMRGATIDTPLLNIIAPAFPLPDMGPFVATLAKKYGVSVNLPDSLKCKSFPTVGHLLGDLWYHENYMRKQDYVMYSHTHKAKWDELRYSFEAPRRRVRLLGGKDTTASPQELLAQYWDLFRATSVAHHHHPDGEPWTWLSLVQGSAVGNTLN